jgi:hypothetical protein
LASAFEGNAEGASQLALDATGLGWVSRRVVRRDVTLTDDEAARAGRVRGVL